MCCADFSLRWHLLLQCMGSRHTGFRSFDACCSMAYRNFPDQRPNPCSLHWQADSQPLDHQGSLKRILSSMTFCLVTRRGSRNKLHLHPIDCKVKVYLKKTAPAKTDTNKNRQMSSCLLLAISAPPPHVMHLFPTHPAKQKSSTFLEL